MVDSYRHTGRKNKEIYVMFICPKCKSTMKLPRCFCGYEAKQTKNIWQLTDMPDIVTNGNGNKYIGYEHIGEAYSGSRKYLIEEPNAIFAEEISTLTGDGIFLDLACGDGCFTVPCAANGTKIIAGDISNKMLSILVEKAKYNSISLDNVTLCRMNALSIPICDESVDTVVANSVLHLISNPEKVVLEVYRVLKKGGAFICKDDAPGKTPETAFDNSLYFEIVNTMYRKYWERINALGIYAKKYSWKFDRNAFCDKVFSKKSEKIIERNKLYEIPLKDGFLPRFLARGFSDQVDIPKNVHDAIIQELLQDFKEKYGEDFANISLKGMEENIAVTIYYK